MSFFIVSFCVFVWVFLMCINVGMMIHDFPGLLFWMIFLHCFFWVIFWIDFFGWWWWWLESFDQNTLHNCKEGKEEKLFLTHSLFVYYLCCWRVSCILLCCTWILPLFHCQLYFRICNGNLVNKKTN
jgi:hypothetical protein